MIIICAWCKSIIGEKDPIEINIETHGICEPCLINMIGRIQYDETLHMAEKAFGGSRSILATNAEEEKAKVNNKGKTSKTETTTTS